MPQVAIDDTMTGLSWDYPEFKGFHANVQCAQLATTEGPITMDRLKGVEFDVWEKRTSP